MTQRPTVGDNDDKREPEHLKPADPGPCPKVHGCRCSWHALDLGWIRGWIKGCPIHQS